MISPNATKQLTNSLPLLSPAGNSCSPRQPVNLAEQTGDPGEARELCRCGIVGAIVRKMRQYFPAWPTPNLRTAFPHGFPAPNSCIHRQLSGNPASDLSRFPPRRRIISWSAMPCRRSCRGSGVSDRNSGVSQKSVWECATMPMFEFVCDDCDQECELLVNRGEHPVCPHCGSKKISKLMSVSAGRVAGGGALPIARDCPPPSAPPCGPGCCRLPS